MATTRPFQKASIKDVARRAGVSTTTVSVFVNGREDVCAASTAERIRRAIAELNYTPNSLSRSLLRGATRTLGACLYNPLDHEVRFGGEFFERLWRGIMRETDVADYSLLHYPVGVRTGSAVEAFLDGRVDGVLFHGGHDERHGKVARAGMPVVLLTRSRELPDGCGAAYADEARTVAVALDHLRGLGHRRIAHLAGPRTAADVALWRLEAFVEQQRARGEFDPALLWHADAWRDDSGEKAAAAVAAWRSLPEPPTAVFCANDALAVSLMKAASASGWPVPDGLSVVGVDDSAEARQAPVPLTSVAVPVEEIGREGVRCLLRLMDGEPAEACRSALPVTDIAVRGSTAAASPQT
jgi:DNA-binding LacI/PurR family transcriptional regulator